MKSATPGAGRSRRSRAATREPHPGAPTSVGQPRTPAFADKARGSPARAVRRRRRAHRRGSEDRHEPAPAIPRIDLAKLPAGAPSFLGREAQLALLDDAWADGARTQVVELVAPGGVGKTALVKRWLDRLKADAWREGHRRLYEHLKASTPHRPDGLAGLQPLYQAVAHGCPAGLHQQARVEVYRDRMLQGTGPGGFYSWRKLGAFGANLGAVACFEEPWRRV